MWSNKITRLLRYLKDILAALLMGIGILLPPPESAKAANPSSTSDIQTIEQRVATVRRHLHNQQLGQSANVDKSDQTSTERLAQWYNWPNWGNWNNWPNWRNWGNWFNR
jgi:hypothetical protein